jgi:hypothetical protein
MTDPYESRFSETNHTLTSLLNDLGELEIAVW